MFVNKKKVLLLFFTVMVAGSLSAFQVDLPKPVFDLSSPGNKRSLLVLNKGQDILAVEVGVLSRAIDLDGNEPESAPSLDFDVYPSQLLINPGEEASVTLLWKGTSVVPTQEVAYRIETKEIPFNDSSQVKVGAVQLLVGRRYLTAAYVTPPGAKPNLRLYSLVPSGNEGQRELVVTLENAGTAHQIVSNFAVTVTHRVEGGRDLPLSSPVVITDPVFRQKVNILPDGKRRFVIPWPSNLPLASLKGSLTNVE